MKTGGKAVKAEKPLLLNGKPFQINALKPAQKKLIAFLDALPDDEILDKVAIIQKGIASKDSICVATQSCEEFNPYRLLTAAGHTQQRYLFGNPRAIAALKKLIEAQS
jgi:hypothetical protein